MLDDILGVVFLELLIIGIVFVILSGVVIFGLVFLIKGIVDLVREHKGKIPVTKYKGGKLFVLIGSASVSIGIILIWLLCLLLSNDEFFNVFGKFIDMIK